MVVKRWLKCKSQKMKIEASPQKTELPFAQRSAEKQTKKQNNPPTYISK
jgi:hypothetical protein